jgi:hypothetical protein
MVVKLQVLASTISLISMAMELRVQSAQMKLSGRQKKLQSPVKSFKKQ